jgi:hypothetical protein
VLLPLEGALHQGAGRAGGGGLDPEIDLLGVVFDQFGLVVERVHLADAAIHEQLNDAPRLRPVVQPAALVGAPRPGGGEQAVRAEEVGQRQPAEAGTGVLEQVTARKHVHEDSSYQ